MLSGNCAVELRVRGGRERERKKKKERERKVGEKKRPSFEIVKAVRPSCSMSITMCQASGRYKAAHTFEIDVDKFESR